MKEWELVVCMHVYTGYGALWLNECLNRDTGVASLSLTGDTELCPRARHFILWLVLILPDITEKLFRWT